MNEQAIAKLQVLKAESGIQMRWQNMIDEVIADLSAPPPVSPSPLPLDIETESKKDDAAKSKVTTVEQVAPKPAVHTAPAKTKGK